MSPPGEESRRSDVGVGRHHHAASGDVERGLVIAGAQPVVVEGGVKDVLDQLPHGATARALRKIDQAILQVELAADRLGTAYTVSADFMRFGSARCKASVTGVRDFGIFRMKLWRAIW